MWLLPIQIYEIGNKNKIRTKRAKEDENKEDKKRNNDDPDPDLEPESKKPKSDENVKKEGKDNVRRTYPYLTKLQIETLEDYYKKSKKHENPNKAEKEELAKKLEVELKNIKRWFDDRRHNDKEGSCIQKQH